MDTEHRSAAKEDLGVANGSVDAPRVMVSTARALVVDLDGTLTPVDTLVESCIQVIRRQPWKVPSLLRALMAGRAQFKQKVAELASLSAAQLPWRQELIDYLTTERARGRRIVLATAAHESVAAAVADRLRLFDDVIATRDGHNLKGRAKLQAIQRLVGNDFVYAGDSAADVAIWQHAAGAILVGVSPAVARSVAVPIEGRFGSGAETWKAWLAAVRPHQWIKNTLVFVPVLTGLAIGDAARLGVAMLAFLAFCLAASATYLLNDIWDVESDRTHPRKRDRPFASGRLPMLQGLAAAGLLFTLALGVAALVSVPFVLMLFGYAVLTTLYSMVIKQYIVLDVLTLASLYTWRVLAGAIAISVQISTWLLAFAVFIFFSLALVKRCAELVTMQANSRGETHGRNYSVGDLVVLWPLGIAASLSSVVVLGLYIGSPESSHYASREALWLVALALLYWIARVWIKTARDEMHDDPIVFALKDRGSRQLVATMAVLTLVAYFVTF